MFKQMQFRLFPAIALLAVLACIHQAQAGQTLRLAKIINDNMVIQRDKPVTIWGWAQPGAEVTVTITEDGDSVSNLVARAPADPPYEWKTKPDQLIDEPADDEYIATIQYVERNAKPFQTIKATCTADAKGAWEVTVPAMAASYKPKTIVAASGGEVDAASNVLVGVVWLNTGQSNLEIRGWDGDELEQPGARYPAVRFCMLDGSWYQPQEDLEKPAHWLVCSPRVSQDVTGISYYFGTMLHRYLNVPVGIINNARGGTTGQAWCSHDQLDTIEHPAFKKQLAEYDAMCKQWESKAFREAYWDKQLKDALAAANAAVAQYEAELKKFNQLSPEEQKKYRGGKGVKQPKFKVTKVLREGGLPKNDNRAGWSPPAGLFNAVVYPLRKLNIEGMVFYQGENNNFGSWSRYEHTFPRVITSHRALFGEQWPIGIVELPRWKNAMAPELSDNHGYALIRDIHNRNAAKFDHCDMIVTNDTGGQGIHPRDKRPVAERCLRWALATVYKKPVPYQGPMYRQMQIAEDKRTGEKFIKLSFDLDPVYEKSNADFLANNPKGTLPDWCLLPCPWKGDPYSGFAVAGPDRIFHPATSVTRNGKERVLEVRCVHVKDPVAVRYGWGNTPNGNSLNRGLPMLTFRTDDWPLPSSWPTVRSGQEHDADAAAKEQRKELIARKLAQRQLTEARMQLTDAQDQYTSKVAGGNMYKVKVEQMAATLEQMQATRKKPGPQVQEKIDALAKALNDLEAELGKE